MKVIIAGGRDFNDYEYLKKSLNEYFLNYKDKEIEIICGEAKGADSFGKRYAIENNYNVLSFPADWNKYGKSAGYRRNAEMINVADALVAFWDEKSKGTKNTIDLAINKKIPTKVYYY